MLTFFSLIIIKDALNSFRAGYNPQLAFFYSLRNRAKPRRLDPKLILASLTRQLSSLERRKPLLKPTLNLYKEKEAKGFTSRLLRIEESRVLII